MISERRPADDGQHLWHPLSTRLDETGHLVTRLVGMTLPQFCQVAMLPQGRFQAFLRARSEERHALLQQVFQTERFDRTERWLRERRVGLRRASDAHRDTVADLVSRVSEVADDGAPDDWPADPSCLDDWVTGLTDAASAASADQSTRARAAAAAEATAAAARAAGTELAALQATHAAARRDRDALEAAAAAHADRVQLADRAQRAAGVRALHEPRACVASHLRRPRAAPCRVSRVAGPAARSDDASTTHRSPSTTAGHAACSTTSPACARCAARSLRSSRPSATPSGAGRSSRPTSTGSPPGRRRCRSPGRPRAPARLGPRGGGPGRHPRPRRSWRSGRGCWPPARPTTSRSTLAAAQRDLAAATQTRLLARESLVEIREQRLDGMAAEIARKLAVGACCPVCGSADHPSPASPASGAPDEATEREARREVDDLEVVVEAHAQQVRGLETRLAAALAEAGEALDTLLDAEADTLARLERARAAAATVDPLVARLDALLGEQDDLVRHRERARRRPPPGSTPRPPSSTRASSRCASRSAPSCPRGPTSTT